METLVKREIISITNSFFQVPACLLISKFWLDDILGEPWPLIFMESDALEPFLIAQHFPGLFWGMAIGYGLHCLALIVCLTYLIRSKLYIYAKCQQSSFFFQLGGMRRGGTEEKQEVRGRRRGDSVIAELKDSNMWKNIPICGISLKGWIHHQWNGDVTIIQLYSYKTTTEGNLYYRPKWWIPSKKSLHGEFPRRPCCSIQLRSAWHLLIFLEILQNMSQPSGPTT